MDDFARNMMCGRARLGAVVLGLLCAACPAGDDGSASTEGNDTSATGAPGASTTPDPSATSSTPTTNDPSTTTPPSSDSTGPQADTGSDGGSSGGEDPAAMPCQAAEVVVLPGVMLAADGSVDGSPAAPPSSGDLQDDVDPLGGGTTIGFIPEPDGGGVTNECDIFEQDCPAGEKCMPWANDGGPSWNATRCSPIAADPGAIGDPCTVEGSSVSGIDDCELGAMCFGIDNATQMGTCIEMCSGPAAAPVCDTPATTCVITNNGVLALCRPLCNPLAGECPAGQGCYAAAGVPVCASDASNDTGASGDPCQFINACDDGNMCAAPDAVPDCAGAGCCTPFCAVGDDSACLPGQTCQPFYAEGEAPLECVELLGVCMLP
jgi:hypothetical protein